MNDEVVDLSEDMEIEKLEEYEVEEDDVKSLKKKYEDLYGEEASKFGDIKEVKDKENVIVINASFEKLKNRLGRRFKVFIKVDHEVEKEEVEEEYIVKDDNGKPKYDKEGNKILAKRKVEVDVKVPILMEFETRKPTDKEKFDIQRFGAQNLDDLAKLDDKEYEEANMEIARYLETVVTKPVLTAEQWRNDVEQSIYQNLFFKLIPAGMQTDESDLIDFLEMY